MKYSKINIITGHYGCGKTNFSVNMALDLAKQGKKVTVVDLDIVNPYFRTADFSEMFKSCGIELIAPMYANSNLDIPAINFDLKSIADSDRYVVIDVGGDDEGAKALGRYAADLKGRDMQLLYVVNSYRFLTKEPKDALQLMYEIENASGLKATGIINNSNLGCETDAEYVKKSIGYANELSKQSGIPLLANCADKAYADIIDNAYPIDIYVKKLWE